MNLLVSRNLDDVRIDLLPAPRRTGPVRVLFLNNDVLGWRTYSSEIKRFTADRPDLEAVHIRLAASLPLHAVARPFPQNGGLLQPHVQRMLLFRRQLNRWLTGPLPLSRFDVVHVAPHFPALAVAELKPEWSGRLSVSIDSTLVDAKAQRLGLSSEGVHRMFWPMVAAERKVFAASDLIWATSTWAAASVHRQYGLPPERVGLFPFAITPPPQALRGPSVGPADTVKVAFVGNDWKRKGGPRLLRWHQARWADRVTLHIFTKRGRPHGLLRNVVWHQQVDHSELLRWWLPSMDLFVLPTHSDMSPWAVVEAASAGLPIVSSEIGGLADVVIHGQTGFLVPSDDERGYVAAVERLIDSPLERARMGQAARLHTGSNFDAARLAEQFLDRLVALAG